MRWKVSPIKGYILPTGQNIAIKINNWAASSKFGFYRICEQRRFKRACAFAQSRRNLRCSLIQAVSQEEPSDRKPDPWPLWNKVNGWTCAAKICHDGMVEDTNSLDAAQYNGGVVKFLKFKLKKKKKKNKNFIHLQNWYSFSIRRN